MKKSMVIWGIIIVGFLLRLAAAWYQGANLDEGEHLADAALLLKGLVPFRDFLCREPVFLSSLSLSRWLLGDSLFAGRMFNVVASSLTILLVYLIGKDFFNRKVGIVAASLFAFSPYMISWGAIIKTEAVATLFVAATVYVLGRALSNGRLSLFFASGLLLGVSILSRRTTVVFLFILLVLLAYLYRHNLKELFKPITANLAGLAITFGLPMLYFGLVTSLPWMWNAFGGGQFLGLTQQSLQTKLHVIFSASTMLLPLFALSFLFLGLFFKNKLNSVLYQFIIYFLGFVALTLIISGSWQHAYGNGIFWLADSGKAIFCFLLIATAAVVTLVINYSEISKPEQGYGSLLLLGWFLAYFVFYGVYAKLHIFVDYFNDASAALSVLSAVAIYSVYLSSPQISPKVWKTLKLTLTALIVFSLVFSGIFVLSPLNPYNKPYENNLPPINLYQRMYSNDLINEVAGYLRQITEEDEEIFTGDPTFAAAADRRVAYNINHTYLFHKPEAIIYDPYNLFPSLEEFVDYLKEQQVEYAVVGYRTRLLFKQQPKLEEYLKLKYNPVRTFNEEGRVDTVTLYQLVEPAYATGEFHLDSSVDDISFRCISGEWSTAQNMFIAKTGSGGLRSTVIFNIGLLDSCLIEADLRVSGEAGFVIRYKDEDNHYYARLIHTAHGGLLQFIKRGLGENTVLGQQKFEIDSQRWYRLSVKAVGERFSVYMNGNLWLSLVDDRFREGYIGISANRNNDFTNIVVSTRLEDMPVSDDIK